MGRSCGKGALLAAMVAGLVVGGTASGQGLPLGLPPVGGALPLPGPGLVGALGGELNRAAGALSPERLLDLRALRLQGLVRANPGLLDTDNRGAPVLRSQLVALSPSPASLAIAQRAGFVRMSETMVDELALTVVVLAAPPGVSTREAMRRLRRLDPAGSYDFNHVYEGAAAASPTGGRSPAALPGAAGRTEPEGLRIGMIDTGVDAAHPALAAGAIQQQSFAAGSPTPQAHGTAVASLIAGQSGAFRGAAPGASLYVADVYGSGPVGGSAEGVVRALGWLAGRKVALVNMSIVGPPNVALEAAVKALSARGVVIVAAVGNDGPAAPPMYPASYPQVIAVTGVDGRNRVLPEAGRARHLDFAAPGADMAAAAPGGFGAVRGTSFAAPIVAGRLALALSRGSSRDQAVEALARGARHGSGYGRGLVGDDVRISVSRAN